MSFANGRAPKGAKIPPEVEFPVLPRLPRGRTAPPLELYVAKALELARIEGERKYARLGDPLNQKEANERKDDIASRVEKAEGYARWRWQGYLDGEIASL